MRWWWGSSFNLLSVLLLPLSLLYWMVITVRRWAFSSGLLASYRAPIPVIVIGNISVGGNGKTPFTIALVEYLIAKGYKPAIVSRGYGGKSSDYPMEVFADSSVKQTGDEALLLKQTCNCPVMIDPKRPRAIRQLLANYSLDVIISDDGLQHYAMQRDIEVIMVDGERQFGNQWLIPAGPLRETVSRLSQADYVVTTGSQQIKISPWNMQLVADKLINCKNLTTYSNPMSIKTQNIHAIASIGNPKRFFDTLLQLGFKITPHVFPDHYSFKPSDLEKFSSSPLIMTAKDAVKCRHFANSNWWYLTVQPRCSDGLLKSIVDKLVLVGGA